MSPENSFYIEHNTTRQLILDSNKCCQITCSKHFLSYQRIYFKQYSVLSINSFQIMTDLNQTTKTSDLLCEGCRYHEKAGKSRLLVADMLNLLKNKTKQYSDINDAKPTVNKPVLQIKK